MTADAHRARETGGTTPAAGPDLRRARIAVGGVFVVLGAVPGTWAARIPAVAASTGVDEARLGVALTGMAVGLLAGSVVGRWSIGAVRSATAVRVGTGLLVVALIGPAVARSFVVLTVMLGALGAAGGFLDVAANREAVHVERHYRRPIMSTFHALFSVGGLAGAAGGGLAAAMGVRPLTHFAGAAVVCAVVAAVLLPYLLDVSSPGAVTRRPASAPAGLGRPVAVTALAFVGFSAFMAEGAAADWSAVYLVATVGTGPGFAAAGFAGFSVAMACGRFAADRLSSRFGPVAVVRCGAVLAAAGLGQALILPSPATGVVGFVLLGAGLAPVVPIAFSAAGNAGSSTVLGTVVMTGYVGTVAGPVLIGGLADVVGLRVALAVPVVLTASLVVSAGAVRTAHGGAASGSGSR